MKFYVPAILWALIVIVLSVSPGSNLPPLEFLGFVRIDLIAHFVMYFIFSFLIFYGIRKSSASYPMNNKSLLFTLCVPIIFGIVMELLQHNFITERYFDIMDIFANIIGSIVAIAIIKNRTLKTNKE